MTARIPNQRGYALLELLIAMAMLLVVAGTLTSMLQRGLTTEPKVTDRGKRVDEARRTLERVTRELRASYGIKSASASDLDFLTYTRSGGGSTAVARRVKYSCSAGSCTRSEGAAPDGGLGSAVKVVDGVVNTDIFTYTPNSTDPEQVSTRFVFSITGQSKQVTLSDGVNLRNATNFDD